jgi:hypothetical protein
MYGGIVFFMSEEMYAGVFVFKDHVHLNSQMDTKCMIPIESLKLRGNIGGISRLNPKTI